MSRRQRKRFPVASRRHLRRSGDTSTPFVLPKLSVSPGFAILLGFLIYVDRIGVTLPFLLSSALHEAAHLSAMLLLGVPVSSVSIRVRGAVICAQMADAKTEALCTLAGPCCTLLLALLSLRRWPIFCMVNTLLLVYNLLPIYPLDGGRLLRLALIHRLGRSRGAAWTSRVAKSTVLLLVAVCLCRALQARSIVYSLLAVSLLFRLLPGQRDLSRSFTVGDGASTSRHRRRKCTANCASHTGRRGAVPNDPNQHSQQQSDFAFSKQSDFAFSKSLVKSRRE